MEENGEVEACGGAKPKLKVCGVADAVFAAEASRRGVDYVGVIFAAASPRRVTVEAARSIAAAARGARPRRPPGIVGVFVGGTAEEIAAVAEAVPLDVVQLHGGQDRRVAALLKAGGREVWLLDEAGGGGCRQDAADAVLIDGRDGGRTGGTGRLADWGRVGELKRAGRRVVLAGGISAANVAAAAATGADVLDVNSAIETAPGVKSLKMLDELMAGFQP